MTDPGSINQAATCTERIARVIEDTYGDLEQNLDEISNFVERYVRDIKAEETLKSKDHAVDSMYDLTPKTHKPKGKHLIHVTLPIGPIGADDYLHRAYKMHKIDYMCFRTTKKGKVVPTNYLDQRKNKFIIRYDNPYFGNGRTYESDVLLGATKQEIMEFANRAIHAIEDYHHIFIEGLRFEERRGDVLVFDLVTGS